MFDELARTYFKTEEIYEEALEVLRRYRIAEEESANFTELEKNFLLQKDDYELGLLDSAVALLRARDQRSQVKAVLTLESIEAIREILQTRRNDADDIVRTQGVHSVPLTQAFKDFIAEKRNGWKETKGSEGHYTAEVFPLFLELNGDLNTAQINKAHVTKFKQAVLSLPKNRKKMPGYRDLSIAELMQLSIPNEQQLSNKTKANYLQRLSRFLHWLERHGFSQRDLYLPLEDAPLKKTSRANEEREQYQDSQLSKLFNSADYTQGLHRYSFCFWVPLIGLFTGARENEICQLFTDDIRKDTDSNIWIFNFNENEPQKTKKSLKRPYHARLFPIHNQLIDLGILEFAKWRGTQGEERLFPELPYHDRNKYANKMQRWFNTTYEKKCGITGPTSFHSLRHTSINYLKKKLKMETNEFVYYIGQSESGTESDKRYVKPLTLPEFSARYRELKFDHCVDFSKIRRWKAQNFYRSQVKSIKTAPSGA